MNEIGNEPEALPVSPSPSGRVIHWPNLWPPSSRTNLDPRQWSLTDWLGVLGFAIAVVLAGHTIWLSWPRSTVLSMTTSMHDFAKSNRMYADEPPPFDQMLGRWAEFSEPLWFSPVTVTILHESGPSVSIDHVYVVYEILDGDGKVTGITYRDDLLKGETPLYLSDGKAESRLTRANNPSPIAMLQDAWCIRKMVPCSLACRVVAMSGIKVLIDQDVTRQFVEWSRYHPPITDTERAALKHFRATLPWVQIAPKAASGKK